jgi:type II secretory ATPase GspE/PulE/Tfp pilus assembly ATPase PilB-like protein
LIKNPRADQIAAIAKRHGHISMQMEGVVMVAGGKTSIEELQRALKS